ncbi:MULTISPECIES: glutamate--tRNA ligase [Acinetobacter]|uniref:glutamate--tRNA ligase n=1 Tax=Acinetobacter TaxID=469 RepID=UPI00158E9E7E|nr:MULTISPECIES: glutamate--tRNA ligase [Acinetobacter]QKW81328.1 glutamate--tRNA ligase [Acinetobacter sp. FDAARGOS_724]UXI51757.1 glutamate--tRNA ligase [Acinetobacter variabilis]BCT87920.1 glutamate--tRNA ligase [Acinetobacter variabilis]
MTVRTRIAPSPTGFPHVGTAYIALFNLCFAKQHGGEFILRIEDTDQLRSTPESEKMILDSLRWLGLNWSEGPDVGGPHAPYRQSERMSIYKKYAEELVDKGHAFYCFATAQELDEMRAEQQARGETPRYDGRGLKLSKEEVARRLAAGEPHVIRMKVPTEGVCTFNDMLRGEVEIPWAQVDMQILLKTDGLPTYHLANVVDDHLMQITHVIRGEEWIPSAPKHQLLYKYFGWDMPVLCHMPLLRNPDKSKLSKRKNPTSINYYKDIGVLPEALLNYLGRMGWSMPDEREKFTLAEMIEHFDINRVSLGGPIFDVEKLNWLNGQWIKALSPAELLDTLLAWKADRAKLEEIAAVIQPRINLLSEAVNWSSHYFNHFPTLTKEQFESKKLSEEQVRQSLQFAIWRLESLFTWSNDTVSQTLMDLANQMGVKLRDFMPAFFIAIAGSTASTPVMQTMVTIGPDLTFARLRHALEVVGGPSKKEVKVWEKLNESLKLPKNKAVDQA